VVWRGQSTHSCEAGIISLMMEGDDQYRDILAGPLTSLYLGVHCQGRNAVVYGGRDEGLLKLDSVKSIGFERQLCGGHVGASLPSVNQLNIIYPKTSTIVGIRIKRECFAVGGK
jgi:hypothetical protein